MHEHEEWVGSDPELHKIRHSLAHILAQAVVEMRPGTQLGFGPPIEDGLYYDFILSAPLTEADFPELEKRMRKIINEGASFEREELATEAALKRIDEMGEPYKREYAQELIQKQGLNGLSFYRSGRFLDMCEGPHVETTRNIRPDAFKIKSMSGAYWRGNAKGQPMTRIYAYAFKTKEDLDRHIKEMQLALERDHKKLGRELDIFEIDEEIGRGLPLWLPNGTVIRDEIERLMREEEFSDGFVRVKTPHLAKQSLYFKTGHLPYYAPHMYPAMELKETVEGAEGKTEEVKEAYRLKPMNCPHHHKVFGARPRSYRDLPLRLAEYGEVYRFEDSGALSGILRVRGMAMNDAHIYCLPEQIEEEMTAVLAMHKRVYDVLGIKNYWIRLSTWDPEDPKGREKYVDDPQAWEWSQEILRKVLKESGVPYRERKGEAAFYGPKIDFQFRTVTGREETASTCQLDFAVPKRLNLVYKGADNQEHHPYVIHRAPCGTHERFVAFLLEATGGAFPIWLSPVQVKILPVSDKFEAYAKTLIQSLRKNGIRAEIDNSNDTISKKVRNNVRAKIPCLLVVGEREMNENTVTLRRYGSEKQEAMPFAQFESWIASKIKTRSKSLE